MSSIAVFLVLGGATALAAGQLGKNTVGAKQLKKNAVTVQKIKNGAITGAKIKSGTITGAKIDPASLGTVPNAQNAANAANAAHAANADNAGNAGTAANLNGFQRKFVRVAATQAGSYEGGLAAAPEITMFSTGPLTVYAKCFGYGGSVYGMLFIKTAVAGTLFDSYSDSAEGHPYLAPGTPESNRELYSLSVSGNNSYYYGDNYYVFSAIAPGGTSVSGKFEVGVKQGSPPEGDGPFGPGDACLFGGHMTQQNL
jgi:hypothetical protein